MDSIKDINWVVRTASAQSISKIGKDSIKAIPTLIGALQDNDWRVRYRVVNTLANMGEPAIPALLESLDSKNKIVVKDIRIDLPVDMSVFNLTSPNGYKNFEKIDEVLKRGRDFER